MVDNHDDAAHDNFCVIAGVAGDVEAITSYKLQTSAANLNAIDELILSRGNLPYTDYIDPSDHLWFEDIGTVVVDPNACGGFTLVSAVTDHWEVIGVNLASNADATKHLLNKNLICVVRLHGESALTTILLRWRMMYLSLIHI